MAKPRVIIADEDADYIASLQFKFVTDFFDRIDLEVITEREYFNEYFTTPESAAVLIVSEELYDSSLQRHDIQNIFVMTEEPDDGDTGSLNITQLFKYSSIKEIFNEITGKSAESLNIASVEKKETQIVLVTSAAGGVGKTTVAMGVAACLSKNYKRVLYVNASRLQNFQYLLDNKTALSSPEIYSRLLNPQDSIFSDLVHIIRKEAFSYIPAFKASLLSLGLDFSIFKTIVNSAKKSEEFDYIVVDLENSFDEKFTELLDIADKVIIVTTQAMQSVYYTNLLAANINGITNDKYYFVCNDFDNEKDNALIKSNIDIKFSIENYIEHIPTFDMTKISDYTNTQGIQKTAFLVM